MIDIRQGSTPRITCILPDIIDMNNIANVWLYIAQDKELVVDRGITDLEMDVDNHIIVVKLTQQETLALKPLPNAVLQIRVYLTDGTAFPSVPEFIHVLEVYKGGVIGEVTENA